MKLGFNLLLWTGHVDAGHYPLIRRIKAAGFDGVEVPIFSGDAAHYRQLGAFLRDEGLACTASTALTDPATNPLSPDPACRQAALDRIRQLTDHAAALGAELLIGPYHSPIGHFTGQGPTLDERRRCAEVLRAAADHAQAAQVGLALEWLNRFECYFLTTLADAAAFVREVNHPALGTMHDTFHANIEEKDPAAALRAALPQVRHVHISENDRGTPGRGQVDFLPQLRVLRQGGYDRWLTIEAFGRALPDLAAATRVWRDFFETPDEVFLEGGPLVRGLWARAGE